MWISVLPHFPPGICFCYDPGQDSQPPKFVYVPVLPWPAQPFYFPSHFFFKPLTPLVSMLHCSVYRQNTVATLILEVWPGPINICFVLVWIFVAYLVCFLGSSPPPSFHVSWNFYIFLQKTKKNLDTLNISKLLCQRLFCRFSVNMRYCGNGRSEWQWINSCGDYVYCIELRGHESS